MTNLWLHFAQYLTATTKPTKEAQYQWLSNCLQANQTSVYGKTYQFASIKTIADYQAKVPIIDYESLLPWINKLLIGAKDQLFKGDVIAFERTGGSISGGKLIPYSAQGLADFRQALLSWLAQIINQYHLTFGTVYWALSPATTKPQLTEQGFTIGGGDALYLGHENLSAFLKLSAVPLTVGAVKNIEEWQLLTLYYLIYHDDLRLISIWSPSFLIELMKALDQHSITLLNILNFGTVIANHSLPPNKSAAKRLGSFLTNRKTRELWPHLTLISCWTDASSNSLAKVLQDYFPNVVIQPKGLLSTEATISTPNQHNKSLLCTEINFYEFLTETGQLYLAHELTPAASYQVIVTTNSGLYRYLTGDIISCLGYQDDKAILKFLGRTGITSDLVGEKLTESFVNQCLSSIKGFATLCPNQQLCGYTLLLDKEYWHINKALLSSVEQALCNNPQYAYARKLKQLSALTYQLLDNPSQCYLTYQLAQGKRLGDIKIPALLKEPWQTFFSY